MSVPPFLSHLSHLSPSLLPSFISSFSFSLPPSLSPSCRTSLLHSFPLFIPPSLPSFLIYPLCHPISLLHFLFLFLFFSSSLILSISPSCIWYECHIENQSILHILLRFGALMFFLLILHYIFTSLCSWIMPFFLHLFFLANFSPQALLSKNWRYSLGDEFTICMWVWWIYCFYALVFPGINSIWFTFFYEVDSKCVHATNSNVHRT